jgi:hypothetical protein
MFSSQMGVLSASVQTKPDVLVAPISNQSTKFEAIE